MKYIRYEKLNLCMSEHIQNDRFVLIDYACVLEILDNIGFSSNLEIYIKKLKHRNYWQYRVKLNYKKSV